MMAAYIDVVARAFRNCNPDVTFCAYFTIVYKLCASCSCLRIGGRRVADGISRWTQFDFIHVIIATMLPDKSRESECVNQLSKSLVAYKWRQEAWIPRGSLNPDHCGFLAMGCSPKM